MPLCGVVRNCSRLEGLVLAARHQAARYFFAAATSVM